MAKSKESRDFEKIQDKSRAYDTVKPKSYYPFGRKKGAALAPTPAFCEGWDRIFAKKPEPNDFDEVAK